MRVMEVSGTDFDSLRLVERPVPEPKRGEVLVRITAATLNYRDLLMVQGGGTSIRSKTYVPLSCGCGVISAVGAGVTRFKAGDRVAPTFFPDWISGPRTDPDVARSLGGPIDGVAREYACFPQEAVVPVPDAIGDLEAATLPCAALTAWSALFVACATKPGDFVLLQGTGGVSIAGLQLAKAAGATVIITSSSNLKLERARALGADHVINYGVGREGKGHYRESRRGCRARSRRRADARAIRGCPHAWWSHRSDRPTWRWSYQVREGSPVQAALYPRRESGPVHRHESCDFGKWHQAGRGQGISARATGCGHAGIAVRISLRKSGDSVVIRRSRGMESCDIKGNGGRFPCAGASEDACIVLIPQRTE